MRHVPQCLHGSAAYVANVIDLLTVLVSCNFPTYLILCSLVDGKLTALLKYPPHFMTPRVMNTAIYGHSRPNTKAVIKAVVLC